MQFTIAAEHGDQIMVDRDHLGHEQGVLHVRIRNTLWEEDEIESFTLSVDAARKLARALSAAADLAGLREHAVAPSDLRAAMRDLLQMWPTRVFDRGASDSRGFANANVRPELALV